MWLPLSVTIKMEKDSLLPFLDIHIYRRPDGCLGHKVYGEPTHPNLCLTSSSHHHSSTLVLRARTVCDRESFHGKAVFLKDTLVRMATVTNQIQLLSS